MVKLYVGGLPSHVTEIELLEMFSKHAVIADINIVKEGLKSRGYGFVYLYDQVAADRVIEALHHSTVGDQKISVRPAENKQSFQQRSKSILS
jgi:heterogeneous nuclear ribonucleoprotein A1/A3